MSKGASRQFERRQVRKALNRSLDANPRVVRSYGGALTVGVGDGDGWEKPPVGDPADWGPVPVGNPEDWS